MLLLLLLAMHTLLYTAQESDATSHVGLLLLLRHRCNDKGAIGFVSDPRRLNVAITRPRRGLVLVGSPSTLQRGSRDWAQYAKWARANRVVVGLEQLLGRGADGVAADGKGGGVGVEEDGEELGEDGGAGEEDVVVQVA